MNALGYATARTEATQALTDDTFEVVSELLALSAVPASGTATAHTGTWTKVTGGFRAATGVTSFKYVFSEEEQKYNTLTLRLTNGRVSTSYDSYYSIQLGHDTLHSSTYGTIYEQWTWSGAGVHGSAAGYVGPAFSYPDLGNAVTTATGDASSVTIILTGLRSPFSKPIFAHPFSVKAGCFQYLAYATATGLTEPVNVLEMFNGDPGTYNFATQDAFISLTFSDKIE